MTDACSIVNWKISNWHKMHKILVATEASCHIQVGMVDLRFFLRPVADKGKGMQSDDWYSLWTEVKTTQPQNAAIRVTASSRNSRKESLLKGK